MQLNQKQQKFESINQLLNSDDPDQFLLNLFSAITKHDLQDYHLCSMHLHHLHLRKQIEKITQEILKIKETIRFNALQITPKKTTKESQNFEKFQSSLYSNQNTIKPKRARRAANQIKRHFQCPVQNCQKQYGSEGSLNQHIKMKHEGLHNNSDHKLISAQSEQKISL